MAVRLIPPLPRLVRTFSTDRKLVQPLKASVPRTRRTPATPRPSMRIATLQLNPQLGDFEGNVQRADDILNNAKSVRGSSPAGVEGLKPELLVLPEMALTGMPLSVLS